MDIYDLAEKVESKEDFIFFLRELQKDLLDNNDSWENPDLERYLDAMTAYLSGSTENSINQIDFTPSWGLFAKIMLAASIYE